MGMRYRFASDQSVRTVILRIGQPDLPIQNVILKFVSWLRHLQLRAVPFLRTGFTAPPYSSWC